MKPLKAFVIFLGLLLQSISLGESVERTVYGTAPCATDVRVSVFNPSRVPQKVKILFKAAAQSTVYNIGGGVLGGLNPSGQNSLNCSVDRKVCAMNVRNNSSMDDEFLLDAGKTITLAVGSSWGSASFENGIGIQVTASGAPGGFVIATGSSLYLDTRIFSPFPINSGRPF